MLAMRPAVLALAVPMLAVPMLAVPVLAVPVLAVPVSTLAVLQRLQAPAQARGVTQPQQVQLPQPLTFVPSRRSTGKSRWISQI